MVLSRGQYEHESLHDRETEELELIASQVEVKTDAARGIARKASGVRLKSNGKQTPEARNFLLLKWLCDPEFQTDHERKKAKKYAQKNSASAAQNTGTDTRATALIVFFISVVDGTCAVTRWQVRPHIDRRSVLK